MSPHFPVQDARHMRGTDAKPLREFFNRYTTTDVRAAGVSLA
jgi:hypothetical protein